MSRMDGSANLCYLQIVKRKDLPALLIIVLLSAALAVFAVWGDSIGDHWDISADILQTCVFTFFISLFFTGFFSVVFFGVRFLMEKD